jgi:hypothetical protein
MRPLRIYIDTSVVGGCFDPEFVEYSTRFFDAVRGGKVRLLLSDVVVAELVRAPPDVRHVLEGIPADRVEKVPVGNAVTELRNAYVQAGVIGPRWLEDATHVAAATVARADAIVSWNFRHIVRLDRIKGYNRVNLTEGYGILTILSPREVDYDETEHD